MTRRVSEPPADVLGDMRDDRDIVDHLDQNCYVSGRLQYLIIVVVAVGSGSSVRALPAAPSGVKGGILPSGGSTTSARATPGLPDPIFGDGLAVLPGEPLPGGLVYLASGKNASSPSAPAVALRFTNI